MKMKKLLAVVLALTVALTMGFATTATAFADNELADGQIKITPPEGVAANASNTYNVYKVFDAVGNGTNISYKLSGDDELSAEMIAAGFSVDSKGNVSGPESLSQEAIAAIAAYVTSADIVATVTATGSAPVVADVDGDGYYYITTSTGTVVTIDSANHSAEVIDKNTVPSVDKIITGASSVDDNGKKALAQVGTTVNYSGTITVGKGAKGYVFHDTMEAGLTYNNDAAVTGVDATNYTVGKDGDDTFTVTFKDEYIATLAVGTQIVVTYSATVNDDAVTTDPLNNTCYVSYGDNNSNNRTPDSQADVYEAKFTVTKNQPAEEGEEGAVLNEADGKYYKPLAGAGFVIKNAEGKYYKLTAATEEAGPVVSWVDSVDDATEYTSDATGAITAFTGLANGTYTLVENTVPEGYNAAADQTFTVEQHNYTAENLEQEATVTNNTGSTLPSTGGIGTTIFYILGALLIVGCGVMLIARRRSNNA